MIVSQYIYENVPKYFVPFFLLQDELTHTNVKHGYVIKAAEDEVLFCTVLRLCVNSNFE